MGWHSRQGRAGQHAQRTQHVDAAQHPLGSRHERLHRGGVAHVAGRACRTDMASERQAGRLATLPPVKSPCLGTRMPSVSTAPPRHGACPALCSPHGASCTMSGMHLGTGTSVRCPAPCTSAPGPASSRSCWAASWAPASLRLVTSTRSPLLQQAGQGTCPSQPACRPPANGSAPTSPGSASSTQLGPRPARPFPPRAPAPLA